MVNLRGTLKPRNYLSRREQFRLLTLVLGLGLVAFMMDHVRRPENWDWFFALDDDQAGSVEEETAPIDTRIAPKRAQEEIPGTFHSPPQAEPADTSAAAEGYFPGVEPKYLAEVRDDTPFRYAERHAWFNLLDVLNRTKQSELRGAAIGQATFAQLFQQPDDYRGELVTIRGVVRRAHRLSTPENDVGIETFYQLWISPDDHRSSPIVVYCLKLPSGFPLGMDLREDAQITGFFFKRWAYKAADMVRTAPVLAAKTLAWQQPVESSKPPSTDPITLGAIVGVSALASGIALFFVLRRTKKSAETGD